MRAFSVLSYAERERLRMTHIAMRIEDRQVRASDMADTPPSGARRPTQLTLKWPPKEVQGNDGI
jgi:hypothetical protein